MINFNSLTNDDDIKNIDFYKNLLSNSINDAEKRLRELKQTKADLTYQAEITGIKIEELTRELEHLNKNMENLDKLAEKKTSRQEILEQKLNALTQKEGAISSLQYSLKTPTAKPQEQFINNQIIGVEENQKIISLSERLNSLQDKKGIVIGATPMAYAPFTKILVVFEERAKHTL